MLAAIVAGLAVAAAALFALSSSPKGGGAAAPPRATPQIYGETAPAASVPAPARATRADAERVARNWASAWTRLTACPADAPRSLRRVLALSTGDLRQSVSASPPRPTAENLEATTCAPPKLRRVEVHPVDGGWYAIAVRAGDGLRPLRLRLRTVDGNTVRVAAIDF